MASLRKLLLLSVFVAGAVAVPVSQRSQCARYCTDESDFSLSIGNTYTYDYETTTVTTVQGVSQDKSQLQMTAQADIEVISKCELALRLRGVTLKLSDPESPEYLVSLKRAREFARTVERQTLRFSFQNGQVEHVCPSEGALVWVTNIQKGVLSAFQTYNVKPEWTTRTLETDILGKCNAEYHSLGTSWQGTHTVRKFKDLTSCTDREDIATYLQGTPYAQDFERKSLPVVKGSQDCEQVIGNNFLQTSTCNEKLVFRPFSGSGNGVVTAVSQKLIFASRGERKFTGNDYRPTTEPLLFSHAVQEVGSAKIDEETETALKELCEAAREDISISVPRKFSTFVYKLKKLPLRSLKAFYQKTETLCPGNSKARKFFMDAIPLVSTVDSARFMHEMITQKTISETESNFWLTSLSFITETTPEIIATFTPLLDGLYEQAILGVSSLIRNYCQGKDCSNVPEVEKAVSKLIENLGENCFAPEDKLVILSLKAIGNIGYMFGREGVLEACYKNPQIRNEARLAAIEAFRRASCDISREHLMKTYSNYDEDTEIRIAAYLGAMKCASPSTIQSVKEVMMKERINHVGSFIWTHLNALSKTKHPERQPIRDLVSDLYLMNKYASDARKLSSAHEAAFFLESIDSGIHVDSHLIFSTDSYLPRTAMFNLTVDVFGRSCNLFQVDGRLEGLEHFVESFFGPSGYFPQKNVAKLLRERRAVDGNKLAAIDSKFNEFRNQPQPYGSLDVKVFGTSMWYNQFKPSDDGTPDINLLDIVTKLAEENDMEYSRSFMFLDTTFTIPMTSGLPLKIALNGTASVGLKIGGKFDVKSFEHVDVLGHIEPSGAIEIESLLTVDAGNVARSGMRIVSTMHSSSVLDGKVQVRKGEVVKVQFNMPRDRIDIFNVERKLFLVHGNEEKGKVTDKKTGTHLQSCTGKGVSNIFGVKLCTELEVPPYRANTPLHPLDGPARFNLFIEKTDPTLKSYNFDAQWKTDAKNGGFIKHGVLSLNTPETKLDRDVKMEFYLNQADLTATLKLKTPIKKLGVDAKMVNTESQKKLDFGVTVDDKDYFSLQSELGLGSEKNADTYRSSLEIRIPQRRLVAVSGSAELRFRDKYTAQLQIEDLTEKPILAKGLLEMGKRDRCDIEMSLSSYVLDGTVKGYVQPGDSMSSRFTADYRILEGKMNKLNVVGKMRNLSANALTKYTGLLNIQASALPEWDTELSFETMQTTGHIENTVSISLGDGARSRVHTIKLQEILRYEGSLSNNKVDASLSLEYPEKNIDYAVNVKHENTERSLKNALQVQYATNKKVTTDIQLKMNTGKLLSVSGDLKVGYPGRNAALQAEFAQSSDKDYRGTVSCQWREGRKTGIVLHYKNKSDGSRLKYEVDGNAHVPEFNPITFSTAMGYDKGQLAGFAEVNVGTDKYRVKADYSPGNGHNHRIAGQLIIKNDVYGLDGAISKIKDKLSGNVEVKMPNLQRVTAKLEGRMGESLKLGSFETYWDADRDTSKRFVINGELRSQHDGYDGNVHIQIRRRTVKGSLNTSLQGNLFSSQWKTSNKIEFEWSPTEKISGILSTNMLLDKSRQQFGSHIEVISPFYAFENMTFNVAHLYSNQQWNTEVSTLLPWGNDVTLSSSGKYSFSRGGSVVETAAKLQTSYSGYEEMYLTLSHEQNNRELSNKAELKWGTENRISYQVTGVKQSSLLRGSIRINTPFSYLRDISGEMNHAYSNNNYRTSGEVQWAPSKKLTFSSEGNHELSGRRRICTINFEGTSPFRGYQNTAAKVTYSNDGITVNTDSEVTWNRNKITSSFSVSNRNHLYNKNLEGKFSFTSPFRDYENIQVSSSLEMNENSYKINVDTQLPHRSTASLNSQGKMVNLNDLEVNAVLIGNFPRYIDVQRVSVDLVHKLQNSKLRSTLDASYGKERLTILLIGVTEMGYNTRNIEFSAAINTPFRGYEELKGDLAHNQRGYEFFSKIQGTKNKQSGSLTHKLNIRDNLNFETTLEITSTSSTTPITKISIVQASNGRQMEHNSYVQWDKLKKIHLNAQYLDKTFLKEALIKVTTPFRSFRDLELKSSVECQDNEHKGIISAVWDRRNKMTVSADVKNYRWESMSAQVEFTSPFQGYEFYSTTVKYDLTAPQKEAEVSFLWDVNKRNAIVAKGNFLYSFHLSNLDLSLTTPFEDFESVILSIKYQNSPPEKNLNINYERGWRKINFAGRTSVRRNSLEMSMDLTSPYSSFKEIKGLAKYNRISGGFKGELNAQWNRGNNYRAVAQYELREGSGKGQIEVTTPVKDYETLKAEFSGTYENSKMASELSLTWGDSKRIFLNGNFYRDFDDGGLSINIQSPFQDYRNMSLNCKYIFQPGEFVSELTAIHNKRKLYQGSFTAKYGGSQVAEIQLNFDTPYSPLRNIQLILSMNSSPEIYQIMSTLKWEDKEVDVHLLLNRKLGEFYEAKMKLNTPFEGYRIFSFDSSLRNDRNRFMDGRLIIVTPFETLRNFDAYGEFKSDDSGYLIDVKVNTPEKSLKVIGKLANSQFRPFTASLDVEAPFTAFKKVSTEFQMDFVKWNDVKAKMSVESPSQFTHALILNFSQDNENLNFEVKAESSSLKSGDVILTVKANYDDTQRITTDASVQMLGAVHYLNGEYKSMGKTLEAQLSIESQLLPEGKAKTTARLSRRRGDKLVEAELTLGVPSSTHQVSAKYENKGSQISTNLKIESNLLSSSTLECEAKYINSNGRDIEAAFNVQTPVSSHRIVAGLKNYEGEKFVQLKIECPMVTFLNPFTITGTLRHEEYTSMDVSLSVSTARNEVRIAGNMKNDGWQNFEGFFTVNTPFEGLKMIRLDGRFRNDGLQNIDCNLQLETSNENLPSLGLTSKLSRTDGSEEISLMLRLPLRNYKSIQLLSNLHYQPDYSSADSRITFTLPQSKYVLYGQYALSSSRISGVGEIEVNSAKWSTTARLDKSAQKKDIALTFVTSSSQTYSFGGSYATSGNQQQLAATYSSPSNDRYNWNSTMSYENLVNFALDFQAESPFYHYRNIHGSMQVQSNPNYVSSNIEYSKNGRRLFLKTYHRIQREGVKGSIQVGCPYSNLRDVKLSYNRVKKHANQEGSVELDYNRAKQFKLEVLLFGEKSSHIVLDAPVLPLTVTADSKKINNGREINFRSNYYSRVVTFRTSYQRENSQILQDAAFSWDDRAEKRISYTFKLSDTETGKELLTRLDTPMRSLMLNGNFTKTSRTRSGGINFYWDASRSLEKHMAVGVLHADISTSKQTSHKLQINMEHPKLSKDIVQTNVLTYGPSEFHFKSELLYSRERHHNLVVEVRAKDMSRNSRDTHYGSEFTLKHPASRLDIHGTAEVEDSKLESSAHVRLNSLDRHQAQNIREIRAKIMKLRQEIELSMRSNDHQSSVSGRMTRTNSDTDITLETKRNDQTDVTVSIRINRRSRALDLSIMNTENTGLQVAVSFPKESASLKIIHSNKGKAVTDAHLYLGLEQSKILKSTVNWRPKLWEDLRINTGEALRALVKTGRTNFASWSSNFAQECSTKLSTIGRAMSDLLTPFADDMKTGWYEIESDLRATNDAFWKMYYRNEFYMRDIVAEIDTINQVAREVANGFMLGSEVLYNITMEQLENGYDAASNACADICDYLGRLHAQIMLSTRRAMSSAKEAMRRALVAVAEGMDSITRSLLRKLAEFEDMIILKLDMWLRSYAPYIIDGYYYTKHAADKIRYSINGFTTAVSDYILSNPYYAALRNYVRSIEYTFKVLRDYEYAESAQAFLDRVYDVRLIDNLLNHPSVDYMSGVANAALRKSVEVYHNLGLDVVVSQVYDAGSNYLKTLALNSAQEYLSELYQTKAGAKYDFSPERGHVAFEFNLPAPRNSLIEVFDFKSYPEYQKMNDIKTLAAEYYEDFCVWDLYYKFVKYFTPTYWLPSFNARAILSGNQHYITFDKLSYDFAGKCSYLLARDFVDGNFTLIVNYGTENHMRRSLTIMVDGRKVDIGSDYKITLDDTKSELPIQIGKTVMLREGANVRVENEKKGFSVVCNFVHNYCSVSLSGFYFGRTGGLFGTFNYEPSLDMMTPARYVMGDVESFAGSWEVGQAVCRSNDNFATIPSNDYRVQNKCKSLFQKSTSEFRACFKQVNPETYLKMCISDLSAVHQKDHEATICESAAAYFAECKMTGVPLKMPKHCVRCEKQDGSYMTEGDAVQFPRDGTVEVGDVVFLVEEKECNKDRVKYLFKLAQGIEDNFRQKGYRDVRYSVVGFGGDQIHADPHVHTLDGLESGPIRSLESALQSLEFSDGPVNILEAMRYAAALTYRPGTTKSFILMKCSTCKSEEVKAEYSEMLRTLLDGDISLHILMDQKYEMKLPNKNSKGRRVIGADKKFAYTLKDVKDSRLSGDGDLLAQLRIPKDVCIPLAFEVNGSSFDSQFLTETKKNTNKKFMDILARLVVRTSSTGTTDWGMCCECLATEDGVGKSTCQRCVSAEVASMISADVSGINSRVTSPRRDSRNAPRTRGRHHKEAKSNKRE